MKVTKSTGTIPLPNGHNGMGKGRVFAVIGVSFAAHVAVLALAFAMRGEAPKKPDTEYVQVLAGHVDRWTGDFQATGLMTARVRARQGITR